jgi:hypothetical protein
VLRVRLYDGGRKLLCALLSYDRPTQTQTRSQVSPLPLSLCYFVACGWVSLLLCCFCLLYRPKKPASKDSKSSGEGEEEEDGGDGAEEVEREPRSGERGMAGPPTDEESDARAGAALDPTAAIDVAELDLDAAEAVQHRIPSLCVCVCLSVWCVHTQPTSFARLRTQSCMQTAK